MPSLRCLISALTQAGGGGLFFRFARSVQSCYGEGGVLQTDRCVWGALTVSGHTGFAPHRGVCAFPVYTAQAPGCTIWSRPCVECPSSFRVLHKSAGSVAPAFYVFPGLSGSGSQGLGRPLPGRVVRPFPPRPQRAPPVGSQEVFRQEPGPVCRWEGVASLGLSLPLAPPPASFLQR